MTSFFRIPCALAAILLLAAPAFGDTLELADGSLIEGRFVGGTGTSIMFEAASEVVSYETAEIVALWFSAGTDAALAALDAPYLRRSQLPRTPGS